MQIVDWIALGIALLIALIGVLLGFGKSLKIFTSGIVGILISIVVTYFCMGVVASWGFVQDIMNNLVSALQAKNNGFCNFLVTIRIERIILAIILFFIIQALRIIIVNILKGIVESDNAVMKVINKTLGAVFALAVGAMVTLLIFHVVALIGDPTAASLRNYLTGKLCLDWVFDHNPLQYIIR